MATIKESFTKGITTLNIKTNRFIEVNKCKTYIATLEEEIKDLKYKIGDLTYGKWEHIEDEKTSIDSMVHDIHEKREEIAMQEEKIKKLQEEEQQILGNSVSIGKDDTGMLYCSQCGMKNPVHNKFCCGCGKPLEHSEM